MRERVGGEFAHSIRDDHSRLAYTELHPDERGSTVVGFMERAIAFFRAHGIELRRLQTDNAWTYTKNRALADLLRREGIAHRQSRPGCPSTTGRWSATNRPSKGSGAGAALPLLRAPAKALPHWLHHYNHTRRHSSIGNRPPVSRVRDVLRQDS
jgi:transposase InsO family protein